MAHISERILEQTVDVTSGGLECAVGWARPLIHAERSSNRSCRRARGLRRFVPRRQPVLLLEQAHQPHLGPSVGVEVVWFLEVTAEGDVCCWDKVIGTVHAHSFRLLQGLDTPSPFLGCNSCCRGFFLQFVVGDTELGFFRLLGGEPGAWSAVFLPRLSSSGPSSSFSQLQFIGRVVVISVASLRQGSQCKLCINRKFRCAILCEGIDMLVVRVETVQKTLVCPHLQVLTKWFDVLVVQFVLEFVKFLDKVVDMPVGVQLPGFVESAANCGASAVVARRQVWFSCLSLCCERCRWSRQCNLGLRRGQLIIALMS